MSERLQKALEAKAKKTIDVQDELDELSQEAGRAVAKHQKNFYFLWDKVKEYLTKKWVSLEDCKELFSAFQAEQAAQEQAHINKMKEIRDDFFAMKQTNTVNSWVAEWFVKHFGATEEKAPYIIQHAYAIAKEQDKETPK